jgi:hypothetical protein
MKGVAMTVTEKGSLVLILLGLFVVLVLVGREQPVSEAERWAIAILMAIGMVGFIPDWEKRE